MNEKEETLDKDVELEQDDSGKEVNIKRAGKVGG